MRRERGTYREYTLSEDNDVHVEWFEVGRAVLVLVETAETDKEVVSKKLDLLARFFHLDIFCCEWMDREYLPRISFVSSSTHISATNPHILTLLSIFISSSVGDRISSHQVLASESPSASYFPFPPPPPPTKPFLESDFRRAF